MKLETQSVILGVPKSLIKPFVQGNSFQNNYKKQVQNSMTNVDISISKYLDRNKKE